MLTMLMVCDALVAIVLIAAILGQEPKSGGMGGAMGGGDAVFSGPVRGVDALLARITIAFGVLFAVITLAIAKIIM